MATSLEFLAQGRELGALIVDGHAPLLCGFELSPHLDFGSAGDSIVSDAEKLGPCLERGSDLGRRVDVTVPSMGAEMIEMRAFTVPSKLV